MIAMMVQIGIASVAPAASARDADALEVVGITNDNGAWYV